MDIHSLLRRFSDLTPSPSTRITHHKVDSKFHIFPEIHAETETRLTEWNKANTLYKAKKGPHPPPPKQNWHRVPTKEELRRAYLIIKDPNQFTLYDRGHIIVLDEDSPDTVICNMQFHDLTQMNPLQLKNVEDLCRFLHEAKEFVSPVESPARSCGGSMWAVGWRKSYTEMELLGVYRNTSAIAANPEGYQKHINDMQMAADILWDLFFKMGSRIMLQNRDFMAQHNIPSIGDTEYPDETANRGASFFTPHLTFTSDGFYNHPHKDSRDEPHLPFAFLLVLPIHRTTGKLAFSSDGYDVQDGHFIFPQCKFGINFKPNTLCQAIFNQKAYSHGTLRPCEPGNFTKLGMSMQVSSSMTFACDNIMTGLHKQNPNVFISDYHHILKSLPHPVAPYKGKYSSIAT